MEFVDFAPTYIALAQTQRLQKFRSMIYFNKKHLQALGSSIFKENYANQNGEKTVSCKCGAPK